MSTDLSQCFGLPWRWAVALDEYSSVSSSTVPSLLERCSNEASMALIRCRDDGNADASAQQRRPQRKKLAHTLQKRLVDALLMAADRRTFGRLARTSRLFAQRARALLLCKLARLPLHVQMFVGDDFARTEHWRGYTNNQRQMNELIAARALIGNTGEWIRLYRDGKRVSGPHGQPLSHGYRQCLSARVAHGMQCVYSHDDTVLHRCPYHLSVTHGIEQRYWYSAPHALLLERSWTYGHRVREQVFFAQNMHAALQRTWARPGQPATSMHIVFYDCTQPANARELLRFGKQDACAPWTYASEFLAHRGAPEVLTGLDASPLPGAYMLSHDLLAAMQAARQTRVVSLPAAFRHWYLVRRRSVAHALLHHLRFAHATALERCYETAYVMTDAQDAESLHLLYCPALTDYYDGALWAYVMGDSAERPPSYSQHTIDIAHTAHEHMASLFSVRTTKPEPMLPHAFPGNQYVH